MTLPTPESGVTIAPLTGIPEVREGDDLTTLLLAAVAGAGLALTDGDVLALSSKIASKALGLTDPAGDKEAVVAAETVAVVAERGTGDGVTRIVRAAAGPVMAAAGVDASNTGGRDVLLRLPRDPDAVCRDLHTALCAATGVRRLGVVLTDTAGRPWRTGQTDFALGAAGIRVLDDLRGTRDADGRALEVTARAVADELAAAADLVKGKTTGVPAVLVRGLSAFVLDSAVESASGAAELVRGGDGDWFALGDQEAVRAALGIRPGGGLAAQAGIRPSVGDTREAQVRRALAVALVPHLDPWQVGVEVSGPATDGSITIEGADPFRLGLVTARALVALAGEGLPHRLASQGSTSARIEPRVDGGPGPEHA